MKNSRAVLLWCGAIIRIGICADLQNDYEKPIDINHHGVDSESDSVRGRRGVIEEEKYYNIHTQSDSRLNQPWIPGPLPPEDDPTTKISITNDVKDILPMHQTTERVTDKPTGRGARASNENWIKLPSHDDLQREQLQREQLQRDQLQREQLQREQLQRDQRDNILTPPQPSVDLINSRMPRVNFVTQNKALEASESRNDKESIQRAARTDDIRTEFVRPDEDRERERKYKPVYPRQAVYYPPVPDESRRYFYDDKYYPVPEDPYRRDPYYDMADRRRYYPYGARIDRYDDNYDNNVPRKPKRIIYYAHLPEVVRTPPSVDLRYRYSMDPYRRYDDDLYARTGRIDYRFRNRYPYPPLRKDDRNYRDLVHAGTTNKDKKVEDKVTPTPILPQKDDKFKPQVNINRNLISHQNHDGLDTYNQPLAHKRFPDVVRPDDSYLRYDEPLFQGTVEDPYQRKY